LIKKTYAKVTSSGQTWSDVSEVELYKAVTRGCFGCLNIPKFQAKIWQASGQERLIGLALLSVTLKSTLNMLLLNWIDGLGVSTSYSLQCCS